VRIAPAELASSAKNPCRSSASRFRPRHRGRPTFRGDSEALFSPLVACVGRAAASAGGGVSVDDVFFLTAVRIDGHVRSCSLPLEAESGGGR